MAGSVTDPALPAYIVLGFAGLAIAVAGGLRFRGSRRQRPDHYLGGLMATLGIFIAAVAFVAGLSGGL